MISSIRYLFTILALINGHNKENNPNIAEANIIKYTNKKHLKQAAVPYIFDIASVNPYIYVCVIEQHK